MPQFPRLKSTKWGPLQPTWLEDVGSGLELTLGQQFCSATWTKTAENLEMFHGIFP